MDVSTDSTTAPRGRLFDPVRRRWVASTPEEEVRQHTIALLHSHYGYPFELMQVEGTIQLGSLVRRCDIVVFSPTGNPYIVVECKRPSLPITQRVVDQACRYNTALHVPLLLLTNGTHQLVVQVDFVRSTLQPLPDLPHYSQATP